jgi:hypothetical protein
MGEVGEVRGSPWFRPPTFRVCIPACIDLDGEGRFAFVRLKKLFATSLSTFFVLVQFITL